MALPWRSGMADRPAVDFERMVRGRRPLKRWRWVGVFTDDVMLCVGSARVGPAPLSWWAVWDRRSRSLSERTVRRALPVPEPEPAGTSVETISRHGDGGVIWTRKTPVRLSGTVRVGGREHRLADAPGLMDESAGYHARRTRWHWSAGVGETATGQAVAWNLVHGLHDDPRASERTVWVDGTPHHVAPQAFADDLAGVGDLAFAAEATRAHREDLLIVASDYEQPFGTFAGRLPVAGAVRGAGVMERHRARW